MTGTPLARRSLLTLAAAAFAAPPGLAKPAVRLDPLEIVTPQGRTRFQVEFAATDQAREMGLMFRKFLAPDRGMLFDFRIEKEVAFWMKNTLIPLDMVFIRADGHVYSIARNTTPGSLTPVPSGGPVRAVLEIAGGRAAQIGVLPGDRVLHRIFPRG